jgi:hypothetical protein
VVGNSPLFLLGCSPATFGCISLMWLSIPATCEYAPEVLDNGDQCPWGCIPAIFTLLFTGFYELAGRCWPNLCFLVCVSGGNIFFAEYVQFIREGNSYGNGKFRYHLLFGSRHFLCHTLLASYACKQGVVLWGGGKCPMPCSSNCGKGPHHFHSVLL